MPVIQRLPQAVVNKIAAGEVIERPASVVKELMENAVDAGAKRIEVTVAQGGVDLVRVSDDGCGIAPEELPLAIDSHATSKIRDADDLFRVHTLGFRGEALASISAVSHFLRSRTGADSAGYEMRTIGGASEPVAPCGCPVGTTVEVKNLFFNTPVRRKFLRTTQTEMGYVAEAFTRLALANPAIHMTLRHGERTVYELAPAADWRGRIEAFFGAELAAALIPVSSRDGNMSLNGFAANPSHSRSNPRMQYLFLNGRAIRDRSLQHALGEAYRGLLLTGRFPIAFLNIAMPPDLVDVNVHPTKLEVRFQESGRLYSVLLGALRTQFLTTDLTARLQPVAPASEAAQAVDGEHAAKLRRELVDWAKGRLEETVAQAATAQSDAAGAAVGVAPLAASSARVDTPDIGQLPFGRDWRSGGRAPLELTRFDRSRIEQGSHARVDAFRGAGSQGGAGQNPNAQGTIPRGPFPAGSIVHDPAAEDPFALGTTAVVPADSDTAHTGFAGNDAAGNDSRENAGGQRDAGLRRDQMLAGVSALQVHNRYLIAESDDGMIVIDQHALHERILYENLRAKVLAGALESQALLVPEPVDLNPTEAAAVIEARDVLARLGVTVAPFGGDTVLVSSYPAMLANVPPAEVLRDLVDHLLAGGKQPDRRDLLDELLHMISCKAAIKAGDRLTGEEIAALLEQRHLAQDSHHCPHGRPTALIFTREELDRQFKRT